MKFTDLKTKRRNSLARHYKLNYELTWFICLNNRMPSNTETTVAIYQGERRIATFNNVKKQPKQRKNLEEIFYFYSRQHLHGMTLFKACSTQ